MSDIQPGSRVTVSHEVVVNGSMAFSSGEEVVVEQISPNPQSPEHKYVVLSTRLGKRFQLRSSDIVVPPPIAIPSAPYTAPQTPQQQQAAIAGQNATGLQPPWPVQQGVPQAAYYPNAAQQIPQKKSGSRRRTVVGVIVLVAILVLAGTGVAVFLLLKGNNYKQYKINAEVVMTQLEKIDDGLDVGYYRQDYEKLVTDLNVAMSKFERQCSEEEKKYPSYVAIQSATANYILAQEKWKDAVDNASYDEDPDMTATQETWSMGRDSVSAAREYLQQGK